MAAKNINVKLSLKDKFSQPLKLAAKGTTDFKKQVEYANKSLTRFADKTSTKVCNKLTSIGKAGVTAAAALASLTAGVGLNEAMDLEGYRLQLETATKDTEKAASVMKYAISLANSTPFEGGEMVEASAKLEAMSLSSERYLLTIGNMAAGTNKSLDQATEAFIDAQTGELERLKEFGITKAKIAEKANQMFTNQEIINNKGQIVNQEKFNEALLAIMEERFAGGMEKQATTLKGVYSTITGVAKSGLAKIVGISEDGSIRSGSAFDIIKNKAKELGDALTKMQNDGTFDRIAEKVSNGLAVALDIGSVAFSWLKDNINWLIPVVSTVLSYFVAFKAVSTATKAIGALTTAFNVVKTAIVGFNLAAMANPLAWIPAVVAGLVALYHAFEPIKKIVDGIWNAIVGVGEGIADLFKGNGFSKLFNNIWWGRNNGSDEDSNALGTSYFRGGRTRINENGGEIAVLPSGTQIIPHDISKEVVNNSSNPINVTINVQGNIIGNEEYANYLGEVFVRKLRLARGNS